MAIHLKNSKLLFTLAPGTGSTALESYLFSAVKDIDTVSQIPDSDVYDDNGQTKLDKKHCTFHELKAHNLINSDDVSKVVTGVRNPFEFWYSEWYRTRTRWVKEIEKPNSWIFTSPNKLRTIVECCTMEFSDWIIHRFGQDAKDGKKIDINGGHINEASLFLRTEHLEADLKAILKSHYGDRASSLPDMARVNVTKKRDETAYWQHYSAEARHIIQSVMSDYMSKFSYQF